MVFDRYADSARKVVQLARQEADRFNAFEVTTAHQHDGQELRLGRALQCIYWVALDHWIEHFVDLGQQIFLKHDPDTRKSAAIMDWPQRGVYFFRPEQNLIEDLSRAFGEENAS